MKKIILVLTVLATGCQAQENATWWKTRDVTKLDGSAMTGITLTYMEAVAALNIHLSKSGDSLLFYYPYEKSVAVAGLRSLTGYRLEESGELVDSIYEVSEEDGILKLKFHYIGTNDEDNRFSLNLIPVERADFFAQVGKLKDERAQLLGKIRPLEIPRLDLSLAMPGYFNKDDLTALSPMQGVEEFLGVKSQALQPIYRTFDYSVDDRKIAFDHLGVISSAREHPFVAKLGNIHFSELEFITKNGGDKPEAIILARNDLNSESIRTLYEAVNNTMVRAEISSEGLPERFSDGAILGIGSTISLSWKDADKTVKLSIDIPDELYDAESDNDMAITEGDVQAESVRNVFLHYLNLVGNSKATVFIVSEEFDGILRSDNRPRGAWGNIEQY